MATGMTKKATGSACDLCPQNFSCTNISAAMQIVSRHLDEQSSPEIMARYEALMETLQELGVQFPDGYKMCQLANDREKARNLIQEGIALLHEMEKAQSESDKAV